VNTETLGEINKENKMNIEYQQRFLVLFSVIRNGEKNNKNVILDYLENNNYIKLTDKDKELLKTRKEERWRNALAFCRQHLIKDGFLVSNNKNIWEITSSGKDSFYEFIQDIDCNKKYEYFSDKLVNEIINTYLIKNKENNVNNVNETEATYNTKIRIGQNQLRQQLLERGKCQLCNINKKDLLIASHVKPWHDANNSERLDINNTLLLCSLHDSLFDKGYISFDDFGNIILCKELKNEDLLDLKLDSNIKVNINEENKKYIEWHRKNVFRG